MRIKMARNALRRIALAAPTAFAAISMLPTHAQILHATGPLPSFEVATIKPWQPAPSPPPPPGAAPGRLPVKVAPTPGGNRQVSDQVHFVGQISLPIALAYNLQVGTEKHHIVGLPAWGESEADRYKVDAKIQDSLYSAMQGMTSTRQYEEVQLMEQSLLAGRLKLKVHFETRMMPVYTMLVGKGGPKLNPAKPGEALWLTAVNTPNGTQVTAKATTLDDWINSPFLDGLEVVNKTGLQGAYDFNLLWTTDQAELNATPGDNTAAPPLFTAIQEQLGLKLVPDKAPIEVIVIDHIERPSEN
jgi:bla regulator protein BlaR1